MITNKTNKSSPIIPNRMDVSQAFKLYLSKTKGLSKRTVKNYLSDYRNFIDWLKKASGETSVKENLQGLKSSTLKVGELTEVGELGQITPNLLKRYRAYLSSSDLAKSTVKRRLSTIRIFCQFLLDQNLIDKDPSLGLENPTDTTPEEEKINDLITKFRRFLDNENMSPNTVKNYVADARGYLEWSMAVNAE